MNLSEQEKEKQQKIRESIENDKSLEEFFEESKEEYEKLKEEAEQKEREDRENWENREPICGYIVPPVRLMGEVTMPKDQFTKKKENFFVRFIKKLFKK